MKIGPTHISSKLQRPKFIIEKVIEGKLTVTNFGSVNKIA
jgi:hypothetical protein